MSKLYAQITSDKGGRVASKGGENYINITVTEKNRNMFDITFKSTEFKAYLDIMRYSDGTTQRIQYINIDIPY